MAIKVGLGLPNAVHDMHDGRFLVDIGRRAEEFGFDSVATIGRVAYPGFEELSVLSAIAGATTRIGLFTDVLLAPTREPILLARQAATLDQLSGGRFVLGLGVGNREDDFSTTGMNFNDRGRRFDRQLELMHQAWRGEPVPGTDKPVSPRPVNGQSVPIMLGGFTDRALARTKRWGIGFTQGGGGPVAFEAQKEKVDAAWKEAGREGRPEYRALMYYAFGTEATERAEANLRHYYGDFAEMIIPGMVRNAEGARETLRAFEGAGCDAVYYFMEAPGVEQAERLAEALL